MRAAYYLGVSWPEFLAWSPIERHLHLSNLRDLLKEVPTGKRQDKSL